jgi:hypothetical protein
MIAIQQYPPSEAQIGEVQIAMILIVQFIQEERLGTVRIEEEILTAMAFLVLTLPPQFLTRKNYAQIQDKWE